MAIVSRNDATKKDKKPAKAVNIFDKALQEGAKTEVDAKADAWVAAAPVPDGVYKVKVFASGENGVLEYEREDGSKWYSFNLELSILEGEFAGTIIFDNNINTLIRRGLKVSTAISVLAKNRVKNIPDKLSELEAGRLFAKWLKLEPTAWVSTAWQAAYKNDRTGKWVNVFSKMVDFPEKPDESGHEHITEVTGANGAKEEVVARARVKKWLTADEAKEMMIKNLASKGKGGNGGPDVQDGGEDGGEDGEESEEQVVVAAATVVEKPKKPKSLPPVAEDAAAPVKKKKAAIPPPPPVEADEDVDEDEDEEVDEDVVEIDEDEEIDKDED